MAVANENAVKYNDLTDEQITDIKRDIELFVGSEEYWDKFVHHSPVKKGHRTFSSRRLIAPKVKASDIRTRAEFVAPRPTKISVATFEKTVNNYGDKAIYSKEDIQFHFDDTVNNISATLKEIAIQKLDLIKGKPFVESRATITYDTSIINTAENAAIILKKNKVKRWADNLYLAHITPEELKKLRGEVRALGNTLPEAVKKELAGRTYDVYIYGDFMYSVNSTEVMYKSDSVQYIIFMGRRGVDGQEPIDVAKLEGESNIELIKNPLGTGVLIDEDGNYTHDDNKQQGSVAINMDGLGACVSDDLCVLTCEVSVDKIKETALPINKLHGYVSHSGNEHEITESAGTKTHFVYQGARVDSDASKVYASGSTIISVQVVADEGEAFSGGAAPTSSNWTVTYKLSSAGDSIAAEVLGVVKTAVNYDTVIFKVPQDCYSLTVASTATAD